jgi:hypothetical protein
MAKRWAPLLAGGVVLQFNITGCDSEVRTAVLGGVQTAMTGLFTSIINAFFLSLQDSGATSQPVVKAVFESLQSWLA